jgi:hypothetical protein
VLLAGLEQRKELLLWILATLVRAPNTHSAEAAVVTKLEPLTTTSKPPPIEPVFAERLCRVGGVIYVKVKFVALPSLVVANTPLVVKLNATLPPLLMATALHRSVPLSITKAGLLDEPNIHILS